jgi:hypothetical protein
LRLIVTYPQVASPLEISAEMGRAGKQYSDASGAALPRSLGLRSGFPRQLVTKLQISPLRQQETAAGRLKLVRILIVAGLMMPSAALAGQATSSFRVGITITGKANPNAAGAPQTLGSGSEQDWLAYCTARYRSFDPASGTYLGYDGERHPCH